MAAQYDKILKENIAPLLPFLMRRLHIYYEHIETLKDKTQITIERETDFSLKLTFGDPSKNYILHFEFHGKDESRVLNRQLLYRAMLRHKHNLPVRQILFYIGDKYPASIPTRIEEGGLSYRFELVDFRDFSFEDFLESGIPEEIVTAILANFKGRSGDVVLDLILERLKNAVGPDGELGKYIAQLEVLSNLRKLQPLLFTKLESMSITYDLKNDIRFKQGIEKGIKEGIEKGIKLERQKEEAKQVKLIQDALLDKTLTVQQIAKLFDVEEEYVQMIQNDLKV